MAKCEKCGSEDLTLMSRIVGYFSSVSQWNKAKLEELKARRAGNYKVK
jgi:anaerobic ribonucleoside-triphosphate reductase